jgi:hypothetical protein
MAVTHAELETDLRHMPPGAARRVFGQAVQRSGRRGFTVNGGEPALLLAAMDAIMAAAGYHAIDDSPAWLSEALAAAAQRRAEPPPPRAMPDPPPPRGQAEDQDDPDDQERRSA